MSKKTKSGIPLEWVLAQKDSLRHLEIMFLYGSSATTDQRLKRAILQELVRNTRENVERKGGKFPRDFEREVRRTISQMGTDARHADTRQCRNDVEGWLDKKGAGYPSANAAATAAALEVSSAIKLVGRGALKQNAIYTWTRDWGKDNRLWKWAK